ALQRYHGRDHVEKYESRGISENCLSEHGIGDQGSTKKQSCSLCTRIQRRIGHRRRDKPGFDDAGSSAVGGKEAKNYWELGYKNVRFQNRSGKNWTWIRQFQNRGRCKTDI